MIREGWLLLLGAPQGIKERLLLGLYGCGSQNVNVA